MNYRIFGEAFEQTALEQFHSAMGQDFTVQGALMPDAHQGYSLPIGAVVATDNFVLPSWVGYDIGCGMCALPTTFPIKGIRREAANIFTGIYDRVPVGFHHNARPCEPDVTLPAHTKAFGEIFDKKGGFRQLGTLGGGNHFIEIGADGLERVWIIIHSGSRGIGHGAAGHYMRLASPTGKASEGHFGFLADSQEGADYIADLNYCLEFALENRIQIMHRVLAAIADLLGGDGLWGALINRNHNHADLKDGLWIHRKGATQAELGMTGVIPGNMRDGSFIVQGKGNPDSLWSSSHGAGRVLGRKAAKESLSVDDFEATMAGIVAKVGAETLDESPFAYKNIFDVMDAQKDLVEVTNHVKPIINIKG